MNVSQVRNVGSSSSGNATKEDWRVHGKLSLHLSFNYISLVNILGALSEKVVEGLDVINGPKCNKVLNVITFCPKCNKVLN